MEPFFSRISRCLPGLLLALGLAAQAQARYPASPALEAQAWVLMDAGSGQVLAEHQADARVAPGSLVRLLQAWVILSALRDGRLKPDQRVQPSPAALQAPAPRMTLEQGRDVRVSQLLEGLLVISANDAAIALGEALAGSQEAFLGLMNAEAQRLGLEATAVRNLSGAAAPGQTTSARDLARLAARLMREFPDVRLQFRQKELSWRAFRQENPNRLLWLDPAVEGLFSGDAGHVASAWREPRRMVAVVLDSPSRVVGSRDTLKLLNFGFQSFEAVRLYPAATPVAQLGVVRGNAAQAALGFRDGLLLSLPAGQQARLRTRLLSREPLQAPLQAGQEAGLLQVSLGDFVLGEFPVQVLADVPQANWLRRSWDDLSQWLKSDRQPPSASAPR